MDHDGNGLFERFVIDVDVELEQAGEYSVLVYLQHSNGELESLSNSREVQAGRQTISVSFPAYRLHAAPDQTPYTVQQVVLRAGGGRGTIHMDRLKRVWKTKQYRAGDFEPARLAISEAQEQATDDDGDGLYDRLTVSVPVEIRRETDAAAQYSWALGLTDRAGRYIDVVRGEGGLKLGLNPIEISFAGEKIRGRGVDGPYRLGTFLLKASDGSVLMERVGTTNAYSASQFRAVPTGGAKP